MTWLVLKLPDGSAFVEHHALVENETVLSRHDTIDDAREALKLYRDRRDAEEARAAGQMELL